MTIAKSAAVLLILLLITYLSYIYLGAYRIAFAYFVSWVLAIFVFCLMLYAMRSFVKEEKTLTLASYLHCLFSDISMAIKHIVAFLLISFKSFTFLIIGKLVSISKNSVKDKKRKSIN
ncbi:MULTISPECIES: hypothetical protein [Cysteiniphilum]|uniref:hypothetical protein n=1 Tax=Cysteiniphilum TaxID=2056696 RepID=UPI000E354A45|nr:MULTISPECIES: hypothetical protein [Cysteiniphilum]